MPPIARGEAQFVFTGSSARKLRRGRDINLLPGRLVALRLDPLTIDENLPATIGEVLLFGAIPMGLRWTGSWSMRASRHSCYRYSESEAF